MRARPTSRVLSLLLLASLSGPLGCSGPPPVTDPGPAKDCRKLGEQPQKVDTTPPAPTGKLYAELRHEASGLLLPLDLDGVGGGYNGSTRAIQQCDPTGAYTVSRTVVVDGRGAAVATAVREPSGNYRVTYTSGTTTLVSGAAFRSSASLSVSSTGAPPTVSALTASLPVPPIHQGDKLSLSVTAAAAMDDCGLRDSQWWLSTQTSPGSAATVAVAVPFASGAQAATGTLRIPVDLSPGTYFLEGTVTSQTGRVVRVQRQYSTDTTYKLNPIGTSTWTPTSIPVVRLDVTAAVDVDRQAPQALSLDALPARVLRCYPVGFTLRLRDNKALPATQTVKLYVGPLGQPTAASVTLSGSGDTLTGSYVVPLDAPLGVWLAYPESVVDEAGNVGAGSLMGNGRFMIASSGMAAAIPAGAFVVAGQDALPVTDDGGVVAQPDLAVTLPVELTALSLTSTTLTVGQPMSLSVTWKDNARLLK